jgi:hypothetical protein
MKYLLVLACLLLLTACKQKEPAPETATVTTDTIRKVEPLPPPVPKLYSNERFKEVSVMRSGNAYIVTGKAQIFESAFSWVVEDGHNELKKGNASTDAGAPEWGNFNVKIDVTKERQNSTLTLILFESSLKDGSRQYELPVPLP